MSDRRRFLTGSSTPERVQSATGSTGTTASTTFNVNLTTSPVAGNTLVAVISTRGTSANRVSAISGGGVTWSRVSQGTNTSGTTTEIWYGPNVSSGTTGITITQASLRSAAVVIEYSGSCSASVVRPGANDYRHQHRRGHRHHRHHHPARMSCGSAGSASGMVAEP